MVRTAVDRAFLPAKSLFEQIGDMMILAAKTILITITGQKKRDLLEQEIEDGHSSKLPIGRVLAECDQPIDIHWRP